jgi:DNA repair exonuclease SbcCD ATPase subunit/DNA repair exonuclease SbcCD nuclease subunit
MTGIVKIFHIADVHIPKHTGRHNEYKKVFQNFYALLDEHSANQKSILLVCGDLLHNKDSISNEQVMLTRQFLEQCGKRMPVYVIAGNHDMNMVNTSRLDSITPIVTGLDNITYFSQSGYYIVDNIAIVVNSLSSNTYDIDDDAIYMNDKIPFIKYSDIKGDIAGKTSVCLYHGIISGSRNEKNYCFESSVSLSMLVGYDYVMLGDIHKHQYLKDNIAYSGSLIQQNFGEDIYNHGFICWDLLRKTSNFHIVENPYCMYSTDLNKSVDEMMDDLDKKTTLDLRFMVDRKDFKKFGDRHMLEDYIESICNAFRASGKIISDRVIVEDKLAMDEILNVDTCPLDSMNDLDFQNSQIRNYCQENKKSSEYEELMIEMNKRIYETTHQSRDRSTDRFADRFNYFRNFRLKSLRFKNMYSYEEGPHEDGFHLIDFSEYDKMITGIIGMNHVGKSSIPDIILFTLFEKCSRGKRSDVLCKSKKSFDAILEFYISDRLFYLHKKGVLVKGKTDSLRVTIPVFKEVCDESSASEDSANHAGNDRTETTAILKSMLCDYDDLVFTSFLFQNNYEGYIELNQTEKYKFFQRILKTDQFDKQYDAVKGMHAETSRQVESLRIRISGIKKQLAENQTVDYDAFGEESQIHALEIKINDLEVANRVAGANLHPARYTCPKTCASEFRDFMQKNQAIFSDKEFERGESFNLQTSFQTHDKLVSDRDNDLRFCYDKQKLLEKSVRAVQCSQGRADEVLASYDCASVYGCISMLKDNITAIDCEVSELQKSIERYREESNQYNALQADFEQCTKKLCRWQSLQEKYDPKCRFCRTNFDVDQKESLERARREIALKIESFVPSMTDSEYKASMCKCEENLRKRDNIEKDYLFITTYDQQRESIEWNEKVRLCIDNVDKEIENINKEFGIDIEHHKKRITQYNHYTSLCNTRQQYENTLEYLANDAAIKELNVELCIRKQQHAAFEKKHVKIESLQKELEFLETQYSMYTRENALQDNYMEVFGKSGIPVCLFNKSIPHIEQLFNRLSGRLELGFKYTFRLDESKTINIYLNGVSVESCSGFEKLMTSLFMRISIQQLHYFKSKFIFIDEGFSNIDSANLQKVSKIFDILREYFDHIYVITHDADIKGLFDKCILVERNKITKI